jgi:signal transduction histidine kinase
VSLARFLRTHGDTALAIALSGLYALEVWVDAVARPDVGPGDVPAQATTPIEAGLVLAFTISLALRRRVPVVVLGIALSGLVVTGSGPQQAADVWVLALLVAVYSVGAHAVGWLGLVGALEVAALIFVAIAREPGTIRAPGDVLFLLLVLGGPWLAGLAIRFRREREGVLVRRAVTLEQEQEEKARAAVAEERARIARELHDVVAHALSIMVLQARGGRRAMRTDSAMASEAFDTIEATGTEALAEMRRLVGVLRTDDERLALAPQPSLRDLDGLVDQVREAGMPVDVQIRGTPIDLPPGVDLAAYRILQEALTNCLRHAPAATASVLVQYEQDGVDLEVTDTGRAKGGGTGGHGLIGMRERAALYGGTIETGRREGGGFRVRARLPLHAPQS